MEKVYVDQEQDGDENYTPGAFIVYFEGESNGFDCHGEALEFAGEIAADTGAEIEDTGGVGMTATPKSELMRKNRKRRKELGLVEYRVWCTPERKQQHENIDSLIGEVKESEFNKGIER